MPSSIPYDHPSLVLGNIVNPVVLDKLKKVSSLQGQIDSAQNKVNSYISMRRSLEMTINELINMQVDVSALEAKIGEIDAAIIEAATAYADKRLANETSIQNLRDEIGMEEDKDSLESPVDFARSEIKKLPLSADSLKLDAQYFSFDENNEENPLNTVAGIESFIKASTGGLGTKSSTAVASAASSQLNLQRKHHSIAGTLIITASCTHKNARLLTPLVIDADKGVGSWNSLFPGNKLNTINVDDLENVADEEDAGEGLPVLSGAAYGSSFVGMVHLLNNEATGNGPSMTSLAAGLQERFKVGGWFEEQSGGFGVNPSFSEDIRNLLSTQKISTHITVIVMGAIPSIKSNTLAMGVKTFAHFDPDKLTNNLAVLSNTTSAEKRTIDQSANTAKTNARMMAMEGATIQSVMMSLGKIDQTANKVMDINSLMTAFEDYLEEVKRGDAGIPIHFYVKNISKQSLARLWLGKYYPDKTDTPPSGKPSPPPQQDPS